MKTKVLIMDNQYYSIVELAEKMNMNYNTFKSKINRCEDSLIIINNKQIKIIR